MPKSNAKKRKAGMESIKDTSRGSKTLEVIYIIVVALSLTVIFIALAQLTFGRNQGSFPEAMSDNTHLN